MALLLRAALACALTLRITAAFAGSGPLGIDHRLAYDDSGVWKRSNQLALEDLTIAAVIGGSLWEGGETRIGNTFWRAPAPARAMIRTNGSRAAATTASRAGK
jgi:hypothetical protein